MRKEYSRTTLLTSSDPRYCRTGNVRVWLVWSRHVWCCIPKRLDWTIWSVSKAETVQHQQVPALLIIGRYPSLEMDCLSQACELPTCRDSPSRQCRMSTAYPLQTFFPIIGVASHYRRHRRDSTDCKRQDR